MAFERNVYGIIFTCDTCEDESDEYSKRLDEAVADVKADGWYVYKEHGEWKHMCKACLEASNID